MHASHIIYISHEEVRAMSYLYIDVTTEIYNRQQATPNRNACVSIEKGLASKFYAVFSHTQTYLVIISRGIVKVRTLEIASLENWRTFFEKYYYYYWSTRPTTVPAGSDHYFHTECPFVRPFVRSSVRPHFLKSSKQNKQKTMFATGETVGLAEWIIDETCLVIIITFLLFLFFLLPPFVSQRSSASFAPRRIQGSVFKDFSQSVFASIS